MIFYHISKFQIHDISKNHFHSLKNALTLPLTQNTYIYHELYNMVWVGLFLTIFFLFDLNDTYKLGKKWKVTNNLRVTKCLALLD